MCTLRYLWNGSKSLYALSYQKECSNVIERDLIFTEIVKQKLKVKLSKKNAGNYLSTLDCKPILIALTKTWLKTDSNKKCLLLPNNQQVENQGGEDRWWS